jgi:hydroxymethylbilane synthase
MSKIRIGTRGSPLARAQAEETKKRLIAAHALDPADIEIVIISTTGDQVRDRPLSEIGGKGLFTKEIEEALLAGSIDLAVHSMKDMPSVLPDGLVISAVLPREDPRDAMISLKAQTLQDLAPNAVLGSSSVRRTAQALRLRPDLKPVPFRGNVDTRLRKLSEGVADATFLAVAGLNRLGLADRITSIVPVEQMLPAVAQGAVCIEILNRNENAHRLTKAINHETTLHAVTCERAFLGVLDGSCRTPLAGLATLDNGAISFQCEALTLDGTKRFAASREGAVSDATRMGEDAARQIQKDGGSTLTLT